MSQPIAIPQGSEHRGKWFRDPRTTFPADGGPYFGFIEVFESGETCWAVSGGRHRYVLVGSRRPLPSLAFIVEKNRLTRTLTIEITSLALKQAIYRAILSQASSPITITLDFNTLLRYYDALKSHVQHSYDMTVHDEVMPEMRLLVNGVLKERALFEGLGVEWYQQQHLLQPTQLHDIHHSNASTGLHDIKTCFSMGLLPEEIHDEHLAALNSKFFDLAIHDDCDGLSELCEPLITSGEMDFLFDREFLNETLNSGSFDAFLYVLDLLDRTAESVVKFEDSGLTDITFNPFHVAIQLGQAEAVQIFANEQVFFEGRFSDKDRTSDGPKVLTPLSAAVYWDQPDVTLQLLESGPVYLESWEEAEAIALQTQRHDILEILRTHSSNASLTFKNGMSLPRNRRSSLATSFESTPLTASSRGISRPSTRGALGDWQSASSTPTIHNFSDQLMIDPLLVGSPTPVSPDEPIQSLDAITCSLMDSSDLLAEHLDMDIDADTISAAKVYMKPQVSHDARRRIGQGLVQRLDQQCKLLRSNQLLSSYLDATNMSARFARLDVIWTSGLEAWQSIINNEPPTDLSATIHCLLVADCACHAETSSDCCSYTSFVKDLWRWRDTMTDANRPVFDKIANELWQWEASAHNNEGIPQRFKSFAQTIISCDETGEHLDQHDAKSGVRLGDSQNGVRERQQARARAVERQQRVAAHDEEDANIGDILSKLTKDTDSADEEEIEWADYIHLSALEEESAGEDVINRPVRRPAPVWKDIEPAVQSLLASVAFSAVVKLIMAVRDGKDSDKISGLPSGSDNNQQSAAVLEAFLSFRKPSSGAFLGQNREHAAKAAADQNRIARVKIRSKKQARSQTFSQSLSTLPNNSSLSPYGSPRSYLRASMSSPGAASSFLSTTDMSSTDTARSKDRLHCLSSKCPKTFSSVSNRNKHMREGCAFREKKGYRCRNGECTKVLTTKWYRNTHEQSRCRFKPSS